MSCRLFSEEDGDLLSGLDDDGSGIFQDLIFPKEPFIADFCVKVVSGKTPKDIIGWIARSSYVSEIDSLRSILSVGSSWGKTFDEILEGMEVHLVKSKDDCTKDEQTITVTNFFTGAEEQKEIPEDIDLANKLKLNEHRKSQIDIIDLFGCYCPDKGVIFIWTDKIKAFCDSNSDFDFEFLFKHVLLHEYIHALLDVSVRNKDGKLQYWPSFDMFEESLDNALLLKLFWGSSSKKEYKLARKFIEVAQMDLPDYYRGITLEENLPMVTLCGDKHKDMLMSIIKSYMLTKAGIDKVCIAPVVCL